MPHPNNHPLGRDFCVAPLGLETLLAAYPPLRFAASPLHLQGGLTYVAPNGARDELPLDFFPDFLTFVVTA